MYFVFLLTMSWVGGLNLGSSNHIGTTTWVGGCTEYFSGV